jgi:hypothetical protein
MEKEQKMQKLVSEITDAVNNFGFDQELFNRLMSNEHRTLQQSFTRLCFAWIENVASEDYRTDGRNDISHIVCKSIIDGRNNELIKSGLKEIDLKYFKLSKTLPTI